MTDLRASLRLYLVVDSAVGGSRLESIAEASLRGGVSMVQLRAKHLTDREAFDWAVRLNAICRNYGVPFLVNDRLDVALAAGADGVHLGVDDLPLEDVRRLAGPEFIIGYSPETDQQIVSAAPRGADYLGIGPVFSTQTKLDAGTAIGPQELTRRIQLGGLPSVGIGGITIGNAGSVRDAGADGVAVVSAILGAADPESAARQLSRNL